jgi:hypothetical protein
MRKLGITGAVVLLLAGLSAWNAEATPLTGTMSVQPGTNYSLVEKAECQGANVVCEAKKMVACNKGTPQPDCACVDCPPPNIHGCPCGAKSCCATTHGWTCCR